MYIAGTWKYINGTATIGQIVDVPDFTTAALKLENAFPDYTLQSLTYINSPVDTSDLTGAAFLCQYTNKETKTKTTIYIFQKDFDTAVTTFREFYGIDPDSVTETKLTYRQEQG